MPLSFPGSTLSYPPPPLFIARSIGSIQLNDQVNTFFDGVVLPYTRHNVYESVVHTDGVIVRTQRDRGPAKIVMDGIWQDGSGKMWADFVYELENVDKQALVLGDGTKYAQCDVENVVGQLAPGLQRDPGNPQLALRAYKWSITFASYSADRVPV